MSIHFQVKTAWFHSSKWSGAGKDVCTYERGISSAGYQHNYSGEKLHPITDTVMLKEKLARMKNNKIKS